MTRSNNPTTNLDTLRHEVAKISAIWEAFHLDNRTTAITIPANLAARIKDAAQRMRDELHLLHDLPAELRDSVRATAFYLTHLIDGHRRLPDYHTCRETYRQLTHALALAACAYTPPQATHAHEPPDVLTELHNVVRTDGEADTLEALSIRAGLVWVCPAENCHGYVNDRDADTCGSCGASAATGEAAPTCINGIDDGLCGDEDCARCVAIGLAADRATNA